nr:MAG TPA: hypothetical protein [Caudoviricetes sp.]
MLFNKTIYIISSLHNIVNTLFIIILSFLLYYLLSFFIF